MRSPVLLASRYLIPLILIRIFSVHIHVYDDILGSIQKGNRVLGRRKKDFRLKSDETQQHFIHET